MTYKIKYLVDEHDCDTCGWSSAEGYIIYKDGVVVVDKSPVAHCFGGSDYPHSSATFEVLKLEGVEVLIEDECDEY